MAAVLAVGAAICIAGVGVLLRNAGDEPSPTPAPVKFGRDVSVQLGADLTADPGSTESLSPGNSAIVGNGQILRPGLPEGVWQPTESAPVDVGTGDWCKMTGPC